MIRAYAVSVVLFPNTPCMLDGKHHLVVMVRVKADSETKALIDTKNALKKIDKYSGCTFGMMVAMRVDEDERQQVCSHKDKSIHRAVVCDDCNKVISIDPACVG